MENRTASDGTRPKRSPPIKRVCRCVFVLGRVNASSAIGVGKNATWRFCFSHQASKTSGFEVSAEEATISLAPMQRAGQISHPAASNPNPARLEEVWPL